MANKLGDLPIGALVRENNTKIFDEPIVWRVIAKSHEGYPDNAVTLVSNQCISYKAYDAREQDNPITDGQGWARYDMSNIRQWLNSEAGAGNWYKKAHEYDVAPEKYINEAGFLNGFSSFFKSALLETDVVNYVLSEDTFVTSKDKIFLPSYTEIGFHSGDRDRYKLEGSHLEYFADNASRVATITAAALKNAGYQTGSADKNMNYCLRTARYDDEGSLTAVWTDGSNNGTQQPQSVFGIRPMCNIKADIDVSKVADENGVYTIPLRKKLYIFKPDTTEYLATIDDEMLLSQDGFQLVGAPEIDRYAPFAGVMKHKIYYVDGTSRVEDCLATNCPCGRPDTTI